MEHDHPATPEAESATATRTMVLLLRRVGRSGVTGWSIRARSPSSSRTASLPNDPRSQVDEREDADPGEEPRRAEEVETDRGEGKHGCDVHPGDDLPVEGDETAHPHDDHDDADQARGGAVELAVGICPDEGRPENRASDRSEGGGGPCEPPGSPNRRISGRPGARRHVKRQNIAFTRPPEAGENRRAVEDLLRTEAPGIPLDA